MNTVLSLIIMLRQNTLDDDLTHIISNYIIEHIHDIENIGIRRISEECYTSTTSIIKFCRLIGFDNYSEFKRHLSSTLETRKLQLVDKHKNLTQDELFNKIDNLSVDNIDKEEFLYRINQVVNLIQADKKIHFYGAVFPLALTQSFCEDMAIMGVSTYVHQMSYGENHNEAQQGVQVIITISGRYIDTNRSEYKKLLSINSQTVLISQDHEYIGSVLTNIVFPRTKSSDYDDIVFLLILDLIKLQYYEMKKDVS